MEESLQCTNNNDDDNNEEINVMLYFKSGRLNDRHLPFQSMTHCILGKRKSEFFIQE